MTVNEQKTAFSNLVSEMLMNDTEKGITEIQSILGMVNTLFIEGKEKDLSMVLRLHFPDYFTDYKPFEVHG